jgi:hypothetical protein
MDEQAEDNPAFGFALLPTGETNPAATMPFAAKHNKHGVGIGNEPSERCLPPTAVFSNGTNDLPAPYYSICNSLDRARQLLFGRQSSFRREMIDHFRQVLAETGK